MQTFDEIVEGLDNPIHLIAMELGEAEECIHCEACGRYVRLHAVRMHETYTCDLYRSAQEKVKA